MFWHPMVYNSMLPPELSWKEPFIRCKTRWPRALRNIEKRLSEGRDWVTFLQLPCMIISNRDNQFPAFAQWTQMPVQSSVRNRICPFRSNLHMTEEGLWGTVVYVDPLLLEQGYAPRHLQVLLLWLAWLPFWWWDTHAWLGAWAESHTFMLTAGVAKRGHVPLKKLVWQWWLICHLELKDLYVLELRGLWRPLIPNSRFYRSERL